MVPEKVDLSGLSSVNLSWSKNVPVKCIDAVWSCKGEVRLKGIDFEGVSISNNTDLSRISVLYLQGAKNMPAKLQAEWEKQDPATGLRKTPKN